MRFATLWALLLIASTTHAAEHASWEEYIKANRYACPGPLDTLTTPRQLTMGGKSYVHSGYKLEVQNPDADDKVKIGIVSAIKDVAPGTKANIAAALEWFKKQGVEWIVANGDLALEEFDLAEVVELLAESGLPTVATLGNSESKSSFSRVYRDVAEKNPNLVNGVFVRQLVLDDVELWTVSGYHDKRFVHQGAGCHYSKEEVDSMLASLKPAGKAPVALVSHGPPLCSGKNAIDWIADKKNVGDPELARLIQKANVPFGFFGHIIEAGGTAVGKDLSTPIAPSKAVPSLYVNAGSLAGDPWGLNDGSTATGMAMIVTIAAGKASYEVKRFKPPAD
jgi:Icc-related predicted phosphoesterase